MHPRRRGRRSSRPRKGSFPASEEILYAEPLDFRLIGDPVALVEHVLETHFLALVATTFSDTDPHAAPHATQVYAWNDLADREVRVEPKRHLLIDIPEYLRGLVDDERTEKRPEGKVVISRSTTGRPTYITNIKNK